MPSGLIQEKERHINGKRIFFVEPARLADY